MLCSGTAIGAVTGPVGIALGGLAGAILGGLAGGAVGSLAGTRLGEEIDARVLDNFECQACGHVFSNPDSSRLCCDTMCPAPSLFILILVRGAAAPSVASLAGKEILTAHLIEQMA